MAGAALTTASVLMCPHGGSVSIVSANTRAKAAGAPIATASDTFMIAGCAFTLPGPTPSPCMQVQWIVPAMRLKAGGAQRSTPAARACASRRPERARRGDRAERNRK